MSKNNILQNIPSSMPNEVFETLIQSPYIKIERILSKGHRSEEGFWYDQAQSEWVMLIKGSAIIEFETEEISLDEGDYLNIEAHRKHRVKWTHPDVETIWLAIFYE